MVNISITTFRDEINKLYRMQTLESHLPLFLIKEKSYTYTQYKTVLNIYRYTYISFYKIHG